MHSVMITGDTITAVSTAAAPATRMIIRISGPQSHTIACAMTGLTNLQPASAQHGLLSFDNLHCPAWTYAFRAPHSYTGEDCIEFHLPGSPALAKLLLDDLYRQGIRHAQPGEFTARAFFNGKIELTEAEGVAATIAAGNESELRAARQLFAGELARRLQPIMESLAKTLALIEVGIDFSEEDVTFLASDQVLANIAEADQSLAELLSDSDRFEQLTHEPRIVLAGRPNAGKSSLINALAKNDRAVVSDEAGTTRDVLTARVRLRRGFVLLTDIAGLEPADEGSSAVAEISQQMQTLANGAIQSADHLLLVHDCTDPRPPLHLPRQEDIRVFSKSDLEQDQDAVDDHSIRISSLTGAGLDRLREMLDGSAFGTTGGGETLALNARHLSAIADCRSALRCASGAVSDNGPELVAMDLREALDALGQVVGAVTPDDVLGKIFSSFCIGK